MQGTYVGNKVRANVWALIEHNAIIIVASIYTFRNRIDVLEVKKALDIIYFSFVR